MKKILICLMYRYDSDKNFEEVVVDFHAKLGYPPRKA